MNKTIGESLNEGVCDKLEVPAERIVAAFCRSASSWNLQPREGWSIYKIQKSANNTFHPILLHCSSIDELEMSVRILQIFDERLVFHVKLATVSKSLNITISEFFNQADSPNNGKNTEVDRKLEQRFSLYLFAPLLQPQRVFPTLPMLPATPLLLIFSFLSARELCQVSQATKALTALSSSDEVWRGLVASDFAVMSTVTKAPATGSAFSNRVGAAVASASNTTGASLQSSSPPPSLAETTKHATTPTSNRSIKEHYRYHYLQRLAAARRERYLLDRQQQATAQEAHWWWHGMEGSDNGSYGHHSNRGPPPELWLPALRLPPVSLDAHADTGAGVGGPSRSAVDMGLGFGLPSAPSGGMGVWF